MVHTQETEIERMRSLLQVGQVVRYFLVGAWMTKRITQDNVETLTELLLHSDIEWFVVARLHSAWATTYQARQY